MLKGQTAGIIMWRLMWRFIDWRYAPFSTLFMGIVSGVLIVPLGLLGFSALPAIGFAPPTGVWLVSLIGLPLTGALLYFSTKRIIYLKSFFVATATLMSLVHGGVAWYFLSWGMGAGSRLLVGLGIVTVLFMVSLQTHLVSLKAPERETMPHEVIGALDEATGIVDPTSSSPLAKKREKQILGSVAWAWRLAPITAALSTLLVRALPATGDLILVVVVAIGFATLWAVGAGSNASYVVASRRWEREHGKQIHVRHQ